MNLALWLLVGLLVAPAGTALVAVRSSDLPLPSSVPSGGYSTVAYGSSVDRWALSYTEWLPTNYVPTSTYPLLVYLHGQQDTSGRWFSGGLPNTLLRALNGTGSEPQTVRLLVSEAQHRGFLLIAVNTRSGSGWYINSPCGGPQEQDVLDAIAHEKLIRHVGSTYLLGMSMGTEGTLYLAARHPGMFRAVGIVGPVTDLFLDVAYRISLANDTTKGWALSSLQAKMHLFCGVLPGTSNASQMSVARMFQNMSPLRFAPAAFHGIPIYVTAGGWDNRAPNNPRYWPWWLNANHTFLTSTCSVAARLGEPGQCTTPLDALHLSDSNGYSFRYVWEPRAGHLLTQLYPPDLFDFWSGRSPGGVYVSGYPFTSFVKDTSVPY